MKSNYAPAVQGFARGERATITEISEKRRSARAVDQQPHEARQTCDAWKPMDQTLKAMAQLIAEHATMAMVDRDFAVIGNLLHRECGWNDDALHRLGKALSAELLRRDNSDT